jgi:hypothetical protein
MGGALKEVRESSDWHPTEQPAKGRGPQDGSGNLRP